MLKLNNCIISLNIVVEMDGFFKVIQDDYMIKLDDPEIQELKRAVDILMLRFTGALQDSYPGFNIVDVVACGSMEEGTRVRETDETKAYLEFDYLAVLKSFPDSYQLRFRISLSGCMEILRGTRKTLWLWVLYCPY